MTETGADTKEKYLAGCGKSEFRWIDRSITVYYHAPAGC
jgi:hypothetical protein